MDTVGRDKISQIGNKNKMKIDNRQNKHNSWLYNLILGILIAVIAAGIIYWIGWN